MKPQHGTTPIADSERADVLDALRGFALIGIFISHVPDFSGYSFASPSERAALDAFGIDGVLAPALEFLIRGKFFSLFSLLFGIGFSVQLESAARRGANFALHFSRRLAVLFAIGLAHASLWYGDILKDYALIGFLLILTARWSVARLIWATGAVLVLRALWPIAVAAVLAGAGSASPGDSFGDAMRAFADSNLGGVFEANFELVRLKALQMVYDGRAVSVLGMFLLGSLIGRLRLYRKLESHRGLFLTALLICAPIGILGNVALVRLHAATPDFPPTEGWVLEQIVFAVAVPALTLAYASGFALAWSFKPNPLLGSLAPAGRMALTTYVTQTLIGIAIFYGVGARLGGQIGLAAGVAFAIAIFAMQCLGADAWLRRFHFGPLEWLWRRATYGKPVPFARSVQAPLRSVLR